MSNKETPDDLDLIQSFRDKLARKFNKEYSRFKSLNWWRFSKMWLVISWIFVFMSVLIFILISLIDLVNGAEPSLAVAIISLFVGVNPISAYIVLILFLILVSEPISIATTGRGIVSITNENLRYAAHLGKIVVGSIFMFALYFTYLKNLYPGIMEFIAVTLAIAGLIILPIGFIMWGVAGLLKERDVI